MTKCFLKIVNTHYERFIFDHKILSENESSRSRIDYIDTVFSSKESSVLKQGQ